MTTLADVNATLGVTNIALAGVSKNTEKTNEGITGFLDYLKGKDAVDRRREIESTRETKPILKSITGGAAAIGGGLVSAGKSAFGFGKGALSKLAIPAGFVGGFLTSLLSSKLLKGGILGLGLMFGDEIAEMLTGPNAKQAVKDQVAGAIKGGSIGFLFGPRFGAIGALLGALVKNPEIDKQAGELVTNLKNMGIDMPKLSDIFKKINAGVADGLKGINAILKGNFSVDSTVDALKLLGGAAFLISPAGSLFLLKGMARTRVGRVLMALAGIGYATGLFSSDDKKVANEGGGEFSTDTKPVGEDVGGFTSIFKGLDTIDTALLVSGLAYLTKQVADLGMGMYNMFTSSFSKKVVSKVTESMGSLIKNAKGLGSGFLKGLLNAGRFGMSMVGNLPVLLPLAAMGGLLYVLNNKESSQKLAMDTRANKLKGTMTQKGIDAGINITGGGGPEMMDGMLGLGKIYSDSPTMAKIGGGSGPTLAEYFQKDGKSASIDGNLIDAGTVKVNSDNINTYQNSAIAIGGSGAFDIRDNLGKQIQGFGT